MIHPDTELCWISPEIGHGVRATRRIPRGTLTWVLCKLDRAFTRAEADALGPLYRPLVDRYAYVDHLGRQILCWDAGRHVNHHCDANTRGIGLEAQIAVRDIEAGEELTCDYGECNLDALLSCHCGSRRCRGTIAARDLDAHAHVWDHEVAEAVAAAISGALPQPLLPYTSEPEQMGELLCGRAPVPSILRLSPFFG